MLIESLNLETIKLLIAKSIEWEKGRRTPLYNTFKWWGRRFAALGRGIALSLVLEKGDEPLLFEALKLHEHVPPDIRRLTKNKVVFDPFVGAGTLLVEARFLGFKVYGIDISPSAVAIAKTHFQIFEKGRQISECLRKSLIKTRHRVIDVWDYEDSLTVHTFLTRCHGDTCEFPSLLQVKRSGKKPLCLVINEDEDYRVLEVENCDHYKPVEPLVHVSSQLLPRVHPLYRAYAVELYTHGHRKIISLLNKDGRELSQKIEKAYHKSLTVYRSRCTPIPYSRETRRLHRYGYKCWEWLYTPRQLYTLRAFIEEAEREGCGETAKLIAGSATRTLSTLAFYYQPYAKVNPGLVIKGYWIPPYPVELNPVSYRIQNKALVPIGRGTLASEIRKIERASSKYQSIRTRTSSGGIKLIVGDAKNIDIYPDMIDHVITDPPYPGMQSYEELELIYRYWLGKWKDQEKPRTSREIAEDIIRALQNSARKLRPSGYVSMFIGSNHQGQKVIYKIIETVLCTTSLGLRRIYWFPGESPGVMGRSKARGIYLVVFKKNTLSRPDATEPLKWTQELAEYTLGLLGDNKNYLSPELESTRSTVIKEKIDRIVYLDQCNTKTIGGINQSI